MRNIFLEKSYTKFGGETIPRLFSKKSKLSIPPDQQSKVLYSLFLLYIKGYQKILKLSSRPLTFTSYKAFKKKTKRRLELASQPHFPHDFRRKIFLLLLYSIN